MNSSKKKHICYNITNCMFTSYKLYGVQLKGQGILLQLDFLTPTGSMGVIVKHAPTYKVSCWFISN